VGNTIGGNLAAEDNSGGLTISVNQIGGDLQCEGNAPAPDVEGNAVVGNREGQCSGR
jgi:hypothetical protein